ILLIRVGVESSMKSNPIFQIWKRHALSNDQRISDTCPTQEVATVPPCNIISVKYTAGFGEYSEASGDSPQSFASITTCIYETFFEWSNLNVSAIVRNELCETAILSTPLICNVGNCKIINFGLRFSFVIY